MSRDRINDLRGNNYINPDLYDDENDCFKMATLDDKNLMKQIGDMEALLKKGKENIKEIEQLYSKSLTNVNQTKARENHQALEELSSETSTIFRTVGNSIKAFNNETNNMKPNKNIPIRKSQQRKLANELSTLIEKYTNLQRKYKEEYYKKMKRQYRIVNKNATDEEIDKALEDNNNQIFAQDLISSSLTSSKNALIEAKEKHDDIKKIENSINELLVIFQDMETLLLTQSDTLIQIEDAVDEANEDIDKASTEIKEAINYRKKSRKRLWIISIIILIILVLLFIYIYATFISPVVNTAKDITS